MAILPLLGLGAIGGGTLGTAAAGLGAAGSIFGGFAKASAARYQAQVATNGAKIQRQNAAYSAAAGSSQITQQGLKGRAQEAAIRAGAAANNLDVNSGSPADVQQSQRELDALDTETVARRSAAEVYGYQSQATGYDAQAAMDRAQVGPDIFGGFLGAAGQIAGNPSAANGFASLLSGPPKVPDTYAWMQNGDADVYANTGG